MNITSISTRLIGFRQGKGRGKSEGAKGSVGGGNGSGGGVQQAANERWIDDNAPIFEGGWEGWSEPTTMIEDVKFAVVLYLHRQTSHIV